MTIDPTMFVNILTGLVISIIGFFLVRYISKIDSSISNFEDKFDKLRDRLINQREKQLVHEAKVDQELLQVEKNIGICLAELRTLHQLQMDVNNIGHKVRKIEDKKA